jgi:hypothetical protein
MLGDREISLYYFIDKCVEKYNDINIRKMRIFIGDRECPEYTMCYNKEYSHEHFCGPDWTFYWWPEININSFRETVELIKQNAALTPTVDAVGWHGSISSAPCDIDESKTRPLLYQLGQEHPNLLQIFHTHEKWTPMQDLPKYKYLIDIGGNGYSGRLKYLFYCKRPVIIIDRPFVEFYYSLLIPYVHYIPVKRDLSDLLEQIQWMKEHEDDCMKIAENGYQFALEEFTEDKLIDRVYYVYKNLSSRP